MSSRKKVCIVATVPMVLHFFMRKHIEKLSEVYDVTLLVPATQEDVTELLNEHVSFIPFVIERKISLVSDLRSLLFICKVFKSNKFDCVLSIMPKSGLISMLGSFFTRVPTRIHIFTGQVWSTRTGFSRWLLKSLDKVLSFCATHLLADSFSQRDFLIESGVVKRQKIGVLGKGSISGVDLSRFRPNAEIRSDIRRQLGIPETDFVFLFLGRVARAKGVLDLVRAFTEVGKVRPGAHLLVVGPDDDGTDASMLSALEENSKSYHRVGFTKRPQDYMAASDVFCMPSYREGFGLAVIEASAAGLPALASRIYGLTDAVEEGTTGIFHAPGNSDEIAAGMLELFDNDELRQAMSLAGIARVKSDFSEEYVVGEMLDFFKKIHN
ncbi:glycosyltransferase family 4 protein [Pseudomonas sp. AM4(2022)]|uniref:glycosyltransferase family 4 protein n=1 Tax=Pseudomonas sp. AM4(2022) TaxID=2983408 RepID=UPI002E812823|nr:glycosyltransferase family 4 protein [Pseudomonas sp. AM4(2022)]